MRTLCPLPFLRVPRSPKLNIPLQNPTAKKSREQRRPRLRASPDSRSTEPVQQDSAERGRFRYAEVTLRRGADAADGFFTVAPPDEDDAARVARIPSPAVTKTRPHGRAKRRAGSEDEALARSGRGDPVMGPQHVLPRS